MLLAEQLVRQRYDIAGKRFQRMPDGYIYVDV